VIRPGARGSIALFVAFGCSERPPVDPFRLAPPDPDHAASIGPEPAIVHEYHVGEIRRDDAFSTAVMRLGVTALEVDEVVRSLDGLFDPTKCVPGHVFEIRRDEARRLEWLRYTIDPTSVVVSVRGSDGNMVGSREPIPIRTQSVAVSGEVTESLYLAMEAAGEQPWLTLTLVDILAWDVDFFTETQKGDTFRIIVEKRFVGDQLVGYGRVLGVEYAMVSGKRHRAFRFEHPDGKVGYYDQDGNAVEKAFLKSPIKFASITSRYGLRRHPILKYVRAHRGVDYGAPMGTAIWAIGDGVVSFAGSQGGYGRVVFIRHANGLESRYAHLRGFAKGVRSGARVHQKEVVGYVGKSGLATGPHLHFEVLRNGRHANPLSIVVPPAPPIPPEMRPAYLSSIAATLAEIEQPIASAQGSSSPSRR
jgi:murein DD-endopeptidase MepM/ murein hydrolase activator NlpD